MAYLHHNINLYEQNMLKTTEGHIYKHNFQMLAYVIMREQLEIKFDPDNNNNNWVLI